MAGKLSVTINLEKGEIHLPDIGVTMRTILSVAGKGWEDTKRRSWRLMLRGDTFVGTVRVKTDFVKGVTRNANNNGKSDASSRNTNEVSVREAVAMGKGPSESDS